MNRILLFIFLSIFVNFSCKKEKNITMPETPTPFVSANINGVLWSTTPSGGSFTKYNNTLALYFHNDYAHINLYIIDSITQNSVTEKTYKQGIGTNNDAIINCVLINGGSSVVYSAIQSEVKITDCDPSSQRVFGYFSSTLCDNNTSKDTIVIKNGYFKYSYYNIIK